MVDPRHAATCAPRRSGTGSARPATRSTASPSTTRARSRPRRSPVLRRRRQAAVRGHHPLRSDGAPHRRPPAAHRRGLAAARGHRRRRRDRCAGRRCRCSADTNSPIDEIESPRRCVPTSSAACSPRSSRLTDGRMARVPRPRSGSSTASFTTHSEQLSVDVAHLLLRLGHRPHRVERYVNAKRRRRSPCCSRSTPIDPADSCCRSRCGTTWSRRRATHSWREINRLAGQSALFNWHPYRKAAAARDHRRAGRSARQRRAAVVGVARCRLGRDRRTSSRAACEQVYDFNVPGTHNFVAADVFVHNTAFGLGHGRARRADRPRAGAGVLVGDGPRRAHPENPEQRSAGRFRQAAQRPAHRGRLDQARPRRRPARGAAVPRRQPARHGDGDPGQGPPVEGPRAVSA